MTATTKELIIDIAPELASESDDRFSMAIQYVGIQIPVKGYGDNQQMVQTLYAAHILTLMGESGSGSGEVKKETVGRISKEYDVGSNIAGSGFDRTKYGRMLRPLLKVRII